MTHSLLVLLILLGLLVIRRWFAKPVMTHTQKRLTKLTEDQEQLILYIGLLVSGIGLGLVVLYLVVHQF